MAGADDQLEPETKKATSYRYWVRGSSAPPPAPQKLTNGTGANPNAAVGSMWNQAGTWEEKVLSSWALRRVRELLPTVEPVAIFELGTARVTEVTSCSGEASLVTVRQRKRIGYALEIEMKYAIFEKNHQEIEGKMKVPEACYGELDDLELQVVSVVGDVEDPVKVKQTLTKLFLPKIRRKLEEFEAELKER